ncbi:recombinase [Azoarcus indigens]|uniref:NinB protein n=1 Tax=Azoarcus indigens TaxID=29545 RepID=A0A4R6DVI6_9RHOO|nr:recombination protein NinB [Azoarcus indigens]NMG64360.1 recombinase [Azoarcus indigens]TDN49187.1 NinB protein [Azoarcus indigens]
MSALYREFVLKAEPAWKALAAFVAANARSCIDNGKPLRVIVTAEDRKRNAEQNRFYWGAVLTTIAEQGWVDGRRYDKDVWHEMFARRFGVCDEVVLPDGEIVTRRKSTTQMTVGEFSEYLAKVQAYAASELGVEFD